MGFYIFAMLVSLFSAIYCGLVTFKMLDSLWSIILFLLVTLNLYFVGVNAQNLYEEIMYEKTAIQQLLE